MNDKIKNLEAQIKHHDNLYWRENTPEISDEEYDRLVEELRELDPDNPMISRIPEDAGTVKHEVPMLSLSKAYTKDEVIWWAESVARSEDEVLVVSPKYDGVACEYQPPENGGVLATRGDGFVGEDITRHAALVKNLKPGRGELVVMKSILPKLKRPDGSPFKTPRNAAAGILNSKEYVTDYQVIDFMPHNTVIGDLTLADLRDLDLEATLQDELQQTYPVDGLVIKLADTEYGESLGLTSHHPRHSVAFKAKNPKTTSTVVGVVWQNSKTRIAPVAVLEPTELDGVTITRATLHNLMQINRLKVGIGSQVVLERAGSVIPAITMALTTGAEILPPMNCPDCGAPTDNDGQDVWCTNSGCGGTLAKLLRSSLERIGIENAGPVVCSSLVKLGYDSLYKVLCMSYADWLKVEGFAEKSANAMYTQVQSLKMKPIKDHDLLAAMNIEGLGRTLAKKLCSRLNIMEMSKLTLHDIEGVGEVMENRISEFMATDVELLKLMSILNIETTKGLDSGKTVCFTGADSKSRTEWFAIAKAKGYTPVNSVTKSLSLLVCDSLESQSSKCKKSRKYGIEIVTYGGFADAG